MEKIQHCIDDLYREMRNTNVRSHGLKVSTHESWCNRLEHIAKLVRNYSAEHSAKQTVPPPPPPIS